MFKKIIVSLFFVFAVPLFSNPISSLNYLDNILRRSWNFDKAFKSSSKVFIKLKYGLYKSSDFKHTFKNSEELKDFLKFNNLNLRVISKRLQINEIDEFIEKFINVYKHSIHYFDNNKLFLYDNFYKDLNFIAATSKEYEEILYVIIDKFVFSSRKQKILAKKIIFDINYGYSRLSKVDYLKNALDNLFYGKLSVDDLKFLDKNDMLFTLQYDNFLDTYKIFKEQLPQFKESDNYIIKFLELRNTDPKIISKFSKDLV
jgi:DNA-directed RNA polymerase subunit H (RpoH/RPB5)